MIHVHFHDSTGRVRVNRLSVFTERAKQLGATVESAPRDKGRETEHVARLAGRKIGAFVTYAFAPSAAEGWIEWNAE